MTPALLNTDDALKAFDKIVPILQHHLESDVFVPEKVQPWPRLETGFLILDHILGGGLPKGCITEIFGPESLGKSTICAQLAAAHQRADENNRVLYLDFEQTMDIKRLQMLGVDTKRPRLIFSQPKTIEEGALLTKILVGKGLVNFVVWDTVAASKPAAEINAKLSDGQLKKGFKDIDEGKTTPTIGLHARVFTQALGAINPVIAAQQAIMLFPNQERTTINTYGAGSTTSGGKALRYYAACRIRMSKEDTVKESLEDDFLATKQSTPVELVIQFHVVKNKAAPPFRKGAIRCDIRSSGKGFMELDTIFDLAVKRKVIEKSGYYFTLPTGKKLKGTEEALTTLRGDEAEFKALREALKKVTPKDGDDDYEELVEELPEGQAAL